MTRIVLLTTDTTHHRYFFNRLRAANVDFASVVLETEGITPPFPIGPLYEDEEIAFEKARWNGLLDLESKSIEETHDINAPAMIRRLKEMRPDLGLVYGTRRLSQDVIACFKDGLINVHRGMTERYRGLDSELWTIYHNDWHNIGVTLHMVDSGLDTGPIVTAGRVSLAPGTRLHQLRALTAEIAADLMIETLMAYDVTGTVKSRVQSERGRYYSFMPVELKREMRRRFEAHCQNPGKS